MLAIDPSKLRMTVFVYPTREDAERGTKYGGCGFLVIVPSRVPPKTYLHVVTNAHLLGFPGDRVFLRFNSKDGKSDYMDTAKADWQVSGHDDLAALSLGNLPEHIEWGAFHTEIFLNDDCLVEGWPLGVGDEVFMLGRFVTLLGKQKNNPVMRFGNIAMLPDTEAPVRCGDGADRPAFLVDTRSLSGFSGSPALVQLAPTRSHADGFTPTKELSGRMIAFLGIVCSHLPFWVPVRPAIQSRKTIPDMFVETNGGMAVIIPAWRILAFLNSGKLMEEREAIERQRDKGARHEGDAI